MFKLLINLTGPSQKGQSLLEAIVAVSVIVMVLVALVSAITFALSNAQFARNKTQATKYAQEAIEWLRNQRDSNWALFYSQARSSPGAIYCLNTLDSWPSMGNCTGVIDDQFDLFSREATLTYTPSAPSDSITIHIRVFWREGSGQKEVVMDTFLTQWK